MIAAVRSIKVTHPDLPESVFRVFQRVGDERLLPKGMYFSHTAKFRTASGEIEVDSRPSDAIALATELAGGGKVIYAGHSAGGLSAVLAAKAATSSLAVLGLDLTDADGLALAAANDVTVPALGLIGEPSSCNAPRIPWRSEWRGRFCSVTPSAWWS